MWHVIGLKLWLKKKICVWKRERERVRVSEWVSAFTVLIQKKKLPNWPACPPGLQWEIALMWRSSRKYSWPALGTRHFVLLRESCLNKSFCLEQSRQIIHFTPEFLHILFNSDSKKNISWTQSTGCNEISYGGLLGILALWHNIYIYHYLREIYY